MNLLDYAEKQSAVPDGRRKRCQTCSLEPKIRQQIEEGRATTPKVPFPLIAKWLESETGKRIQPNTIRNHFVAGHHND